MSYSQEDVKNDRLFSISEAGGDCKYWPDFGRSFVNIEEDMVTTQYNERGRIISKTGPGWEKRYDDNGNLAYEKSSDSDSLDLDSLDKLITEFKQLFGVE